MSLVKWSRPEISVASTVDKRVHVSQRITWQDVLGVVGRFEMDLRRKHADLRATDRRALHGAVRMKVRIARKGTAQVIWVKSDLSVLDLEPHVVACMNRARFPESGADMEVRIDCIFDNTTSAQTFERSVDPFADHDDDPFADPYAPEVPDDEPGFGDPF